MKIWICDDNIHILAHGHAKTYEVKNEEAMNEINWSESDAKNEWNSDIVNNFHAIEVGSKSLDLRLGLLLYSCIVFI